MARQQLLHSGHAPHFEAVVDESVLDRVVGSPAVMQAQLERLVELSDLPNVTLRVIPYEAGALPAGNNKFIILGFAKPAVSDVVFTEGLTGDLCQEDPRDVEIYRTTFRTLVQLAARPDATRDIIAAMIPSYRTRASWPTGRHGGKTSVTRSTLPRGSTTSARVRSSRGHVRLSRLVTFKAAVGTSAAPTVLPCWLA